jgi:hypothetical protein
MCCGNDGRCIIHLVMSLICIECHLGLCRDTSSGMSKPVLRLCTWAIARLFEIITVVITACLLVCISRAIQARRIQILHTVLGWGDTFGYRWKWEELSSSQDGVSLSCLHVAAALDDGGYAGESWLMRHPMNHQHTCRYP